MVLRFAAAGYRVLRMFVELEMKEVRLRPGREGEMERVRVVLRLRRGEVNVPARLAWVTKS